MTLLKSLLLVGVVGVENVYAAGCIPGSRCCWPFGNCFGCCGGEVKAREPEPITSIKVPAVVDKPVEKPHEVPPPVPGPDAFLPKEETCGEGQKCQVEDLSPNTVDMFKQGKDEPKLRFIDEKPPKMQGVSAAVEELGFIEGNIRNMKGELMDTTEAGTGYGPEGWKDRERQKQVGEHHRLSCAMGAIGDGNSGWFVSLTRRFDDDFPKGSETGGIKKAISYMFNLGSAKSCSFTTAKANAENEACWKEACLVDVPEGAVSAIGYELGKSEKHEGAIDSAQSEAGAYRGSGHLTEGSEELKDGKDTNPSYAWNDLPSNGKPRWLATNNPEDAVRETVVKAFKAASEAVRRLQQFHVDDTLTKFNAALKEDFPDSAKFLVNGNSFVIGGQKEASDPPGPRGVTINMGTYNPAALVGA